MTRENEFKHFEKSYGLSNTCLLRIFVKDKRKYAKTKLIEKWLMSDIIQYVENPEKQKYPGQKYIGKIKLTKIKKAKFDAENHKKWTPPLIRDDEENRASVDDIQIVVYSDDKMLNERRYEVEHGWKEEWYTKKIYKLGTTSDTPEPDRRNSELFAKYQDFLDFENKWKEIKDQYKVPGWYKFDPRNPDKQKSDHNMMKAWDFDIFNFLKEQKWLEETRNHVYQEKSEIVIDCSQILGIGGEAIVIRVPSETSEGYDALKIIPVLKYNFTEDKHRKIDKFLKDTKFKCDLNQIKDDTGINSTKESSFAEVFSKEAENHDMMDEDAENAENSVATFEHNSLISYSNVQLDFIKVFGEEIYVMTICKPIKTLIYFLRQFQRNFKCF